jgi:N-acetylmuramoyl-L-alanine amidase
MSVIGICIGHSRSGDNGAVNTDGVSEHTFNGDIGRLTADLLRKEGHTVHLVDEYSGGSYSSAICWVSDYMARLGVTVAVELHFNSAGPFAEGHEWLHWFRSTKSQKLASCFNQAFKEAFPNAKVRGVKSADKEDRGSLFLRITRCPAVILEPFFGSNKKETAFYTKNKSAVAASYAKALTDYLK